VAALWRGSDLVDEHISDQPVAPLAPRIATRAAEHSLPAGLVAALDLHLRAHSAGGRLDEVIEELTRIREEAGWPPLAAPIGQVLASQALLHVLSAERYQTVVDELRDLLAGRYGEPPGEISPQVRRAVELTSDGQPPTPEIPDLAQLREQYGGIAASEEELLLLALFGDDAKLLLETIRGRGRSDSLEGGGVDASRAERIREIVRIVQESGVGEVTIEDAGLRVTVRRTPDTVPTPVAAAPAPAVEEELTSAAGPAEPPVDPGVLRVEAPMVGTFYRAPSPGSPPFVEEGDAVAIGQTLCILEAMKLMNEVKADQEGIVRRIVPQNAQPVEYGELLFELEPVNGRPPGL
jgi:oxaloacetate decarboxylase alpha subunit